MHELSILSWNVLADAYVRPSYFPFTAPEILARGARAPRIVERLSSSGADVICLQELEPDLFAAISSVLSPRGYAAHFLKKTAPKPDGCGTFVRGEHVAIESFDELRYEDGSGHVALLAILSTDGRRFGVANTHVKWDAPQTPESDRWAPKQIAELLSVTQRTPVPWILCGDFNATSKTGVYATLLRAGLADAYASTPAAYTSNANRAKKRIDYFFHSPELALVAAPLPAIEDDTPLPSATEPSDHLAISARFRLL